MAAFGTGTEKHGMIYLGSLFVILNKPFRDQGVKKKKKNLLFVCR